MKNFGIKLAAVFAIAVFIPALLSAGIFDLSPIVCNNKFAWIIGAPIFVFAEAYLILGKVGLANPLFGLPDAQGKQKSYATIIAVAIAAGIACAIQIWVTSEC